MSYKFLCAIIAQNHALKAQNMILENRVISVSNAVENLTSIVINLSTKLGFIDDDSNLPSSSSGVDSTIMSSVLSAGRKRMAIGSPSRGTYYVTFMQLH